MAKITKGQNRIESVERMRIKYDLEEIFGISLKGTPELRQALGQAIIDRIEKRTKEKSKDINEKAFKKYSKAYQNSDDFKASGKTSKVNMSLTGDMLADVDILRDTSKEIVIGFTDPEESAKAHGHVTGGGNLPRRDFFGLSQRDVNALKKQFLPEVKEAIKLKEDQGRSAFEDAVLGLLRRFDGEGEG